MTVGVVIPCRNEAQRLGGVLDALAAQTVVPDEIVVVDDRSTDGTAAVAEAWSRVHLGTTVKVVPGPGRGVAAAVTTGVNALSSEIVVRLDGHCAPAADYIERAAALVRRPEIGVAGGVWIVEAAAPSIEAKAIAIAMAHSLGSGGAMYRRSTVSGVTDVDTVPFGCFRRALWTTVGGLDESLESNEDYEFNYRVRQQGFRVVLDPDIKCVYYARATMKDLAHQYGRYGWWKARMLVLHPRSIRWRQLIPALLAPGVLLALLGLLPNWVSAAVLAGYPIAVLIGAVHAAADRRDWSATGWIAGAFLTLQLAWSLAFWLSLASLGVSRNRAAA